MPGKIIQAATVATDPDGDMAIGSKSFTSLPGGSKSITSAAIAEPLVAESTPCRGVWIGAPCSDDGIAVNSRPVFIGDSDNQNMPILATNYEGYFINIDDAAKIYIKAITDGQTVQYRIFK